MNDFFFTIWKRVSAAAGSHGYACHQKVSAGRNKINGQKYGNSPTPNTYVPHFWPQGTRKAGSSMLKITKTSHRSFGMLCCGLKKLNVMLWGWFAASGTGNLHCVEAIMDYIKYQKVLQNNFMPSVRKLKCGRRLTFQQNMNPKHTSKSRKV